MTKSCENISTKKPIVFSELEIEVAKLLIQLSISNNSTCSNNKADDIESSIVATITRDDDEDEKEDIAYGSKIRYHDIEDIYNVTELVLENKANSAKYPI
ncbi:hypothetical protein TanjilG_13140 [Lupinus angustifolius]|uniref:Uncharacterized protein n=1 Tax=Lupinus angustifolius TaxID=3871 RepID=A0A1J7GK36_LUPAN|nr:hypothetical protein TanjilG_13140 [Lupinus angustifolius]